MSSTARARTGGTTSAKFDALLLTSPGVGLGCSSWAILYPDPLSIGGSDSLVGHGGAGGEDGEQDPVVQRLPHHRELDGEGLNHDGPPAPHPPLA